jgi:hypothetical protein
LKMFDWRIIAARECGPKWYGDLADDCSAEWAGFLLRAEWMDGDMWWWAVYDREEPEHPELISSNDTDARCATGDAARAAPEEAARKLLGIG